MERTAHDDSEDDFIDDNESAWDDDDDEKAEASKNAYKSDSDSSDFFGMLCVICLRESQSPEKGQTFLRLPIL